MVHKKFTILSEFSRANQESATLLPRKFYINFTETSENMGRRLRQRPIALNHGRQVNPAAIALNKGPQAAPVALRVEEKAAVLFTAQQPWKI